jgi:hypothetical protein
LLRARPISAMVSTVRGMRAVYDKEGIAPCGSDAHCCECVPVTSFRTGINDDEYGLHQDYEKWLEGLAPHAPTRQCRPRGRLHNPTGEDVCPERSGRTADAHPKRAAKAGCTLQVMGHDAQRWSPSPLIGLKRI